MLISKFDLYKREWLDLVFADRNRNYGAYDLRSHYGDNMLKALAITVVGITTAAISISLLLNSNNTKDTPDIVTEYYNKPPVILPDKPLEAVQRHKPKPSVVKPAHPQAAAPAVSTTSFKVPVVTNENVTTTPPTIAELNRTAIGPETIKGTGQGINVAPGTAPGGVDGGTGSGNVGTNEPVDLGGLDIMPEPYGGAAAWTKFLQKNVRYPDTEQQGRVLLSFIIEKDGHLSDIKVVRGVSPELDEEAMRVLKIAPAWKPGQQNGKPVRVKYTIPIVFALNQ